MRFLLTGVETNNKGAELMLYAILQEIERKFPDSIVYLESQRARQGEKYIKTNIIFKTISSKRQSLIERLRINGILRRLKLSPIPYIYPSIPPIDYLIDGSGLHFTDQMTDEKCIRYWDYILKSANSHNAKIIFLPQGFGPIAQEYTKKAISLLYKYADLVMPREKKSYDYLANCGFADLKKTKIYTDFTSLVQGTFPKEYNHLRGAVCVIPNMQMVNKGVMSMDSYIEYITKIVEEVQKIGKKVFLLNHEGLVDEKLLQICRNSLNNNIEMVSGLNALETKGLISNAYMVISSRFHGVASALNSCVPCLATSWSHKYRCLFEDYGQHDCILSLSDIDADLNKIHYYLDPQKNSMIRNNLASVLPHIIKESKEMWEAIWKI